MDRRIRAITVACLVGAYQSWTRLSGYAADGLTFREWVLGILAGIAIGGAGGFAGYHAMRCVDRRFFGDDSDER
jgi:hypothetical protein